jgi:hypothetical protein
LEEGIIVDIDDVTVIYWFLQPLSRGDVASPKLVFDKGRLWP